MPVPIIMPKFGFTLESCQIVQWLVREGDRVRSGDPLCEVTTDKVNMEVEATEDGVVHQILYQAGDIVPVTEVICYLLREGEVAEAAPASAPNATPLARRIAESNHLDLAAVQGSGRDGKIMRRDVEQALKVRATPAARRLAAEHGIDLAQVPGTGPAGRVQGTDVRAVIAERAAQAAPEPPVAPARPLGKRDTQDMAPPSFPAPTDRHVVRLEGMRRTIAQRLQKSFQTAPHIFLEATADMSAIEGLRKTLKARHEKLSVTAVLIKACAWALLKHPALNATLENDEISYWHTANIGMAVALPDGLIVPVIHNAEKLSLQSIQQEVDRLADLARQGKLTLDQVSGGTFTISNMGMFGVDRFTAIINPPQVAILAVGRIVQQFVPDAEGKPVLRPMLNLMLSADHRVVDGAHAAHFLRDLRLVLETPSLLAW
ncbi:MAG: 2-oxo acid dehydrogenase subunit E2 [Candidatus Thermofonsia Clade 1 bacterium]|jgi:pyruvate dehydrogenase E2 component (dihydrolipoamide acetyltransferase)|uniref:Dihydrolipoamide acetyltransferase component of pyruvate dehydrogenase complex n=1 Tax=Candidatus Thermofonsia Clade 1 bacterium TaxID=2364210 RepID=A0A2M8PCH6_9CHLR|nr:MAG: 2-oxo acid dehydrogenase subunit E2 [Candidatus Thermofonsia Clade 1 bacterium]RMF52885.1 MAG: 2-oxo acid dehydrogenase subunit E2 [Chloroflexota bacterium]